MAARVLFVRVRRSALCSGAVPIRLTNFEFAFGPPRTSIPAATKSVPHGRLSNQLRPIQFPQSARHIRIITSLFPSNAAGFSSLKRVAQLLRAYAVNNERVFRQNTQLLRSFDRTSGCTWKLEPIARRRYAQPFKPNSGTQCTAFIF